MKALLSTLLGALMAVAACHAPAASPASTTNPQSTGSQVRETRDIVSVTDFGARGNDLLNDAAAIQAAIDSLGTRGGKVYLPNGKYFIGTTGLSIVNNSTQLIGDGGDFDETEATDAPTLIRYTGKGAAITIGSASMKTTLHGIVIRDLEVRGTRDGLAGIRFKYDARNSTFVGRSLVENVSVKGFAGTNGAGIEFEFGVSNTLRRTNTAENLNGIKINAGTTYHLNGVISRSNTGQGIYINFVNGLLIDGMSVLESNDGAGFFLAGIDNSRNIYIRNSHFEENNRLHSSANYQLYVTGRGAARVANLVIDGVEFASSGLPTQSGDIFLNFISSSHVDHIWSNRTAANPVLKYGTTVTLSRYGRQIIKGGKATIDPDNRGLPDISPPLRSQSRP